MDNAENTNFFVSNTIRVDKEALKNFLEDILNDLNIYNNLKSKNEIDMQKIFNKSIGIKKNVDSF